MACPERELVLLSIMSFPPKTAAASTKAIDGQLLTRVRLPKRSSTVVINRSYQRSVGAGRSAFRGMLVVCSRFPFLVVRGRFPCGLALYQRTGMGEWRPRAHVPCSSSAIFSGDFPQTRSDPVANID